MQCSARYYTFTSEANGWENADAQGTHRRLLPRIRPDHKRERMIDGLKIDANRTRMYYEKGYWGTDTLYDVWSRQSTLHANRPYVKDDTGTAFTYAQVDQLASKLATWLKSIGVRNGDIVSFQVPKWAEFAVIYVACLKVGAVMHPLAINFNGDDLVYALGKAKSSVFMCPTFYHKRDYEQQFYQIEDKLPHVKHVLFLDKIQPARKPESLTLSHVLSRCAPFEGKPESTSDEVVCILSTSGSTGTPKQALFTHNTVLFSERSYVSVLNLTQDDIMWMPSPLNHATGFYHGLIAVMLFGGSTVLEQHYRPDEAVALINEEHCTWSHGATPFIYDILHYMDKTHTKTPSMKLYLCGGAPVPASMIEQAHDHGILLCESYGSTESCPHVYVPPSKCLEWNGRWSGIPYEGIEIRVVDEHHRTVPFGVQGEEASRGPHQFVGYLNDPERTAQALDDDGWFYSGDLCYMDAQGRVRVNGRKKEIIIRGGENISANEIDTHLNGCPGIGDHATIGMPDERMGERICTFAVAHGFKPTLHDVIEYLQEHNVQKRLWPERLEFIDAIPHTSTGKVQRYVLAEELASRMKDQEA